MSTEESLLQTRELISALADGQLRGDEFSAALRICHQDESTLSRWDTYHLIGDVLRRPSGAAPALVSGCDHAFLARLNAELTQQNPFPQNSFAASNLSLPVPGQATMAGTVGKTLNHHGPASNDGNFRWKLVAGFASLAAISVIAWNASGVVLTPSASQLAQASPQAQQIVVASPQGPMVRDARLEELLAAHKQIGGASALQEPSGFLRNATFETSLNAGR